MTQYPCVSLPLLYLTGQLLSELFYPPPSCLVQYLQLPETYVMRRRSLRERERWGGTILDSNITLLYMQLRDTLSCMHGSVHTKRQLSNYYDVMMM